MGANPSFLSESNSHSLCTATFVLSHKLLEFIGQDCNDTESSDFMCRLFKAKETDDTNFEVKWSPGLMKSTM